MNRRTESPQDPGLNRHRPPKGLAPFSRALTVACAAGAALACGAGEGGSASGGSASGGSASGGSAGPAVEERPIRMIAGPYLTYAPVFVAQAKGYFADEGLTVEFVSRSGTPNLVPALLNGDVDIVPEPVSPGWINAIARGARVRVVSGKGWWDPDACSVTWILAHEGLFEGGDPATHINADPPKTHRISQNRIAHIDYLVQRALGARGVDPDRLQRVDIPTASEHQGFLNGSLSLSTTSEPWLTRILATGTARGWVAANEVLPGFQMAYFIFGPGMLDERPPDVGARFLRAYLRGVRAVAEGKTDDNLRILAEATQQDEELLRDTCWPSFRPDGRLEAGPFMDFQHWLFEQGLVDRELDPSEFWDPRFLDLAQADPALLEGASR